MPKAAQAKSKSAVREPAYMLWQDYRRDFKRVTPKGKDWGFQRIEYPAIDGADFFGRWNTLPRAQSIPTHSEPGDVVYLSVEGDLEITVGDTLFALKSLDMLAVPANMPRSLLNVGRKDVFYFGIYATNEGGAKTVAAGAEVELMTWEHSRRDFHWTLPLAERWGYHRGSGPLIRPAMLRGHLVRMPTAQQTPWHYAPRDLVFTVIDNEVEFSAANKVFPLKPQDMLVVPAGTPYRYANYGRNEVLFLSIGGKLPPGKKSAYFTEDPGWPIRPDAPTMEVEIDIYGDAKVISGAPPR